ncbi:hypothetical protein H4S06_005236 [Coemansia sp. BCRC 34490]|nr:hypothetical protein H4S06_005236 [Coemansia sp. BCRC 34490]
MHVFARPRAALIAAACLALLQATAVVGLPKSSDSGVEYVKACDSGPDDVTNQCINRIPEDVGIDSGNHACAYHEAEVKCLGLCGNTVTWKTSYKNALKRYRLVCARFIEERLADKDEDEDANGGDDSSPRKKPAAAAASDDSSNKSDGDSKADDGGDSSDSPPKAKKQKPSASNASGDKKDDKKAAAQSKKETAQSSAPSSQKAKPSSSGAKPSPSATDSAHAKSASPSSKAQSAKDKGSTDDINDLINNISSALDSPQAKEKPRQAKNGGNAKPGSAEGDKDKRVKAMLPTMDPEIAGAPRSAHAVTVFNAILVLCAAFAYAFS